MADDIFARLAAPFHPDKVSWRVGSTTQDKTKGMALAYIDARDVMERLDTVVGAANWQDRYEFHGPRTVCYLSIRVDGEWVTKADGAGDSDVESEKGAISDALKRAAVKWGIGRYLYDIASPWVEIEARGKSAVIKQDQYRILRRALGEASEPAQPARQQAPKQQPAGDAPPVKAAYIVNGRDAADFARRVIALVNGAPNAVEIQAIKDANAKGLATLHRDDKALWDSVMQAMSTRTTDVLEKAA